MSPAFLHMESHCELYYILLFQLLQFMEIKIWFKCSFYKDCQTRILLGEDRWQHRKGGIDLFLLFFYFNMIAAIFCAKGNVLKPKKSALNVFMSCPSLPMSAFQHPSELGVPDGLPVLTVYLDKTISTHSAMAHHTSRVDERMESAQSFYQHRRRGWAASPLVYEDTLKITAKWNWQKAPSGTSRP